MTLHRRCPLYELDLNAYPVVKVRLNGAPDDAGLERFLSQVDEALESTEGTFALGVAVSTVSRTSKKQNALMRAWYQRHESTMRSRCVGVGFAIRSRAYRALARAGLSGRPSPFVHHVCKGEDELEAWCAGLVREH